MAAAWSGLGLVQFSEGQADDAMESVEKALALDADSAVAHHTLALLLDEKNDHEGAEQEFQRAQELDPAFRRHDPREAGGFESTAQEDE